MGSQQTIKPETGLIKIPLNYPTDPAPGKLQLLLENNEHSIYHRFSPYADYDSGLVDKLLGFGSKQPYLYDYIDEAKKGLSGLRRFEGRLFPIGSAPRDVIRVTKFLASGQGVVFLGKQFILQANQAFNETQLYNPTSPIVAAGMSLALGQVRPMRHIDIFGGLGGIARSLLGSLGGALADTFFGASTVAPPPGTAGQGALPNNYPNGGKGLIRGKTATAGLTEFNKVWAPTSNKFSWGNIAKSIISSIIPFTFPKRQPAGTKYRADEGSYGIMIQGGNRFTYFGNGGSEYQFGQSWVAGANGIRKSGQYTNLPYTVYNKPDGTSATKPASGGIFSTINLGGTTIQVGYSIEPSTIESKPGVRYGDSVGVVNDTEYEASPILLQYAEYVKEENEYPTKQTEQSKIEKTNTLLQRVIGKINSGVYTATVPDDSPVISSGKSKTNGYDRIFKVTDGQPGKSPLLYNAGVLSAYRDTNVRMVDNTITTDAVNKSLKLPGVANFDAINTLVVLPGERTGKARNIKSPMLKDWNTWEPYKDDQIAFFFYDVVNDKYIPFRATVKGISESSAANWEEMNFIGRADRLYSYGGFSRQLSFNFDVVIGSIVELAPTWKRINYLMSLVKPARYTKLKTSDEMSYNRFMIPPMVWLTIGDIYKKQPIVINNISITIPDDATWETLNEENSKDGWSYLVDYIKPSAAWIENKLYGQFPREAKLNVTCVLLEKERAIAGSANFGHAPHGDQYLATDIDSNPAMHKALVEYQED